MSREQPFPERAVVEPGGRRFLPMFEVAQVEGGQMIVATDSPRGLRISAVNDNLMSILPSVVSILVKYVGGMPSRGTGFFVSPGLVLTCRHVVNAGIVSSVVVSSHTSAGLHDFARLCPASFLDAEVVDDDDGCAMIDDPQIVMDPFSCDYSRFWTPRNDLALLRITSAVPSGVNYFVPMPIPASLPAEVVMGGYPGALHLGYLSKTPHEPVPVNFHTAKRVSVGSIIDQQAGFVKTLISSSHGSSGSPLLSLESPAFRFYGIHIGCFPDDVRSYNFNLAISTSHPYFVSLYKRLIAPQVADDPAVVEYLSNFP